MAKGRLPRCSLPRSPHLEGWCSATQSHFAVMRSRRRMLVLQRAFNEQETATVVACGRLGTFALQGFRWRIRNPLRKPARSPPHPARYRRSQNSRTAASLRVSRRRSSSSATRWKSATPRWATTSPGCRTSAQGRRCLRSPAWSAAGLCHDNRIDGTQPGPPRGAWGNACPN